MTEVSALTPEMQHALDTARTLARLGVPIILLEPTDDPKFKTGYQPPLNWQNTTADPSVLDNWRPGMAVAAVCGHTFDVIDVDPRNGGDVSALDGAIPHIYARASTPSGGDHWWIKSIGQSKEQSINEGIDYQGGSFSPNSQGGHGRGFVFLPPTTRASKVDGVVRSYTWVQQPPTAITYEYQTDASGSAFAAYVKAAVERKKRGSGTREHDVKGADTYLTEGVPLGRQHEVLARIAWEKVTTKCGDLEILFIMKAILSRSQQDMADPWTDEALMSLITSARNREPIMYEPWMYEEAIGLIERTRRAEGLDGGQVRRIHTMFLEEQARNEAKRLARAEEASKNWKDWGEDRNLGVALEQLPETINWLFPNIVRMSDNMLMAAKYKTGKTTMLWSLIKSMVDGTPLFGRFEVPEDIEGTKIGIWNCEMTEDGFLHYGRKAGVQHADRAALKNLRGYNVPFLHNEKARDETVQWLGRNGVKIWIIDSWSKICAWNGIDMSDNSEVMKLCDELDKIKNDAGVESIILTAHTPKNQMEGEESAIGAQNLSGWADTIWMLTKGKNKDGKTGRFLSSEGRNEPMEETEILLDEETGLIVLGEGNRDDHREAEKDKKMEQKKQTTVLAIYGAIKDFVRDNPGCTSTEIKTIPGTTKTIVDALKVLVENEEIIRTPGNTNNSKNHWLPEAAPPR